mmetsp:Transcript_2895/g.9373  ORF Transcript_2895/g.9373 Transcript_2895/m.9373 type:complete len:201 (-) Transcript_2895:175-777(-)
MANHSGGEALAEIALTPRVSKPPRKRAVPAAGKKRARSAPRLISSAARLFSCRCRPPSRRVPPRAARGRCSPRRVWCPARRQRRRRHRPRHRPRPRGRPRTSRSWSALRSSSSRARRASRCSPTRPSSPRRRRRRCSPSSTTWRSGAALWSTCRHRSTLPMRRTMRRPRSRRLPPPQSSLAAGRSVASARQTTSEERCGK